MKDQEKGKKDAYTENVIARIPLQARQSLTTEQLAAIIRAVSASRPEAKHSINIRGTIPFYFKRYYYAFILGVDRRASTKAVELERRWRGALTGGAVFFLVALGPAVLVILLLLYVLKSAVGIDLFPDKHLLDFFS